MTELSSNLLEKFILAEKKENILSEVTPHTALYKFIEIMIELNDQKSSTQKIETQFGELKKMSPNSENERIASLKLLLRKLEENKNKPEELKKTANELNSKWLNFNFDYQNSSRAEYRTGLQESTDSKPLSAISQSQLDSISLNQTLENVYKNKNINDLTQGYWEKLDIQRFDLEKDFGIIDTLLRNHRDFSKGSRILSTHWQNNVDSATSVNQFGTN